MILQLLGVFALSGLSAISTQQNSVSIGRDYSNQDGSYTNFIFSDFIELFGSCPDDEAGEYVETVHTFYYGGTDIYVETQRYNDYLFTTDDVVDVVEFNGFNSFAIDYMQRSQDYEDDVDFVIYTQWYLSSGYTYLTINFAFGEAYKDYDVHVSGSASVDAIMTKSNYGFPYLQNLYYTPTWGGEDGLTDLHWYYVDNYSPYYIAKGYLGYDNDYRQLWCYDYGMYWRLNGSITSYSQLNTYIQNNSGTSSRSAQFSILTKPRDAGSYGDGYHKGYTDGYSDGEGVGYGKGYNAGLEYAEASNSTALVIFTGIIDVALLPINFFLKCLNFEVFGINIGSFVTALLTVAIVIIIFRVIFSGGTKGGD